MRVRYWLAMYEAQVVLIGPLFHTTVRVRCQLNLQIHLATCFQLTISWPPAKPAVKVER